MSETEVERTRCAGVLRALAQRLNDHPDYEALGANAPDVRPADWVAAALAKALVYIESGVTGEELLARPYRKGGG